VLLAAAVRAILCCVRANLGAVEDAEFAHSIDAEGRNLEEHAIRESESVLKAVERRTRPSPSADSSTVEF
jgi:formiminotetrahydrofolate cyclodeaminase